MTDKFIRVVPLSSLRQRCDRPTDWLARWTHHYELGEGYAEQLEEVLRLRRRGRTISYIGKKIWLGQATIARIASGDEEAVR